MVKTLIFVISALLMFLFTSCGNEQEQPAAEGSESQPGLLIFSKTEGWRHDSIEAGKKAIANKAELNQVKVTATEDADYFTEENLASYKAVIFLNTTGTLFDATRREALKSFIRGGGGFVGVHSATDTEYEWPWYGELVGTRFDNHPNDPNVREATVIVSDPDHPSTQSLPERWHREDEWYNFRDHPEDVHVLLEMDTDSYEGSDHPGNHPIAWYHEFEGGRVFYTALGHTEESYAEQQFMDHLWGGIAYAMDIDQDF